MTRRLRPPAPLQVHAHPDGAPMRVRRGRGSYTVTRITTTWIRPAAWWSEEEAAGASLAGERAYYRIVLDDALVYEVFRTGEGDWYLERIID